MSGVRIVTIKSKQPLYTKELEVVNSIEWIHFEENGFNVVAQKGLYEVGDKGVYILPDFCVPESGLFETFVKPQGDYNKSKLGKIDGIPSRVRAIPFNMSLSSVHFEKVYSIGILFRLSEIEKVIGKPITDEMNVEELLGITKFIEPDTGMGQQVGSFPDNMYITDEENIKSNPQLFDPSKEYYITRKIDGSSITIMKSDKFPNGFISSRRVPQRIYGEDGELLENCGGFVTYGFPILEKLLKSEYNNIALRGELCGKGFKGSGNKNNPEKNRPPKVFIYSVDRVDPITNKAVKVSFDELVEVVEKLGVGLVPLLSTPCKYKDLVDVVKTCEDYFEEYRTDYRELIEGCVDRSIDSKVSFKVMNNEYDSKK